MESNPNLIVAVAIVAGILLIVAIIVAVRAANRRAALRRQFGPEYSRVVRERGSEASAVAALEERQRRVSRFQMLELDPQQRQIFIDRWRLIQSRFVDDPSGAVLEADDAIGSVMHARGYPMSDFDQRAADLSVDYPVVVQNYRSARDIALRQRGGRATTEELRQAMLHYRALFDELLTGSSAAVPVRRVA